jgi:hypothetical protein
MKMTPPQLACHMNLGNPWGGFIEMSSHTFADRNDHGSDGMDYYTPPPAIIQIYTELSRGKFTPNELAAMRDRIRAERERIKKQFDNDTEALDQAESIIDRGGHL